MAKSVRNILLLFIILSIPFFVKAETSKLVIPDFAYPQTVSADARALLERAGHLTGDEASSLRIRALLELTEAQVQIDRDSAFSQPALIAAQAEKESAASAGKAMLLILEAQKYYDIYNSRRWTYDRVDAPLEPYPADVAEWSGLQFRTRVAELADSAMAVAAAAPTTPLDVYDDCLSYSPEALQYLPDVESFVRYKAYGYFERCDMEAKAMALARKAAESSTPGTSPYFFWTVKTGADSAALYAKWADSEPARYVLLCMTRDGVEEEADSATASRDRMIALLRSSLERFPDWYGNSSLSNTLARLTLAEMNYTFPAMNMPGEPFDIKVRYSFAKKIELSVYRLPAFPTVDWNPEEIARRYPKVFSTTITPSGTDGSQSVAVTLAEPGEYAVIAALDGEIAESSWRRPVIMITPLLGFSLNSSGRNAAVAVDFASGKPLKGVAVTQQTDAGRNGNGARRTAVGSTGADGILYYTPRVADYSRQYLSFGYNGREYNFNRQVNYLAVPQTKAKDSYRALLFASRQLYHQGDTVEWAFVAAVKDAATGAARVDAATKVRVAMYDANNKLVDSLSGTTDGYGRIWGAFATRSDALTGRYVLKAEYGRENVRTTVMVSDFKLPTFEVEISSIERGVPQAGAVRISGRARTYTGMPVASAKVNLVLSEAYRWRWFSPSRRVADFDTVTGADGSFSFDIPASMLAQDGKRSPDYYAAVTVTSAAAEAQEASRGFTVGKPYIMQIKQPESAVDASKPTDVMVEAYDGDGARVPVELRWTLGEYQDNRFVKIVAHGTGVAGRPSAMNLQDVPAGVYVLEAVPADTALASAVRQEGVVVYNTGRNEVPETGAPLFVPLTSYEAAKEVKLLVGTARDEAYALVAVSDRGRLASVSTHRIRRGFHRIGVKIPDGSTKVSVVVYSVANGNISACDVAVKCVDPAAVSLVAESFRDRLVPGSGEQWRFRLLDADSAAVTSAAMIATLYNRALDKLESPSWPSSLSFLDYDGGLSLSAPSAVAGNFRLSGKLISTPTSQTRFPAFMFWETELFNSMPARKLYAQSAMTMRGSAAGVNDFAASDLAVSEDMEEEVADAGAAPEQTQTPQPGYRVAETLQGFWQPGLTADSEGNIDIRFTMPDAIGGWSFKGFAWNAAASSAAYAAECVSSKPVMVQPNLPRFLRQGDKATVRATVYNNSGESATVRTTMEVFDPATGAVKSQSSAVSIIGAGASAVVGIPVEAYADASSLGFRVRSVLGAFADGEQALIPVLASSATVVESTEFYLNPAESKPFVLTVPAAGDATVTLQYCQNPVWTVVKAMRGLSDPGNTSTGYARTLFSALAGKKIIGSSPAVAAAIRQWRDNPSEDALKSMLERNEELKKLLLDRTPWAQAAAGQSIRMAALAQFLEPAAVDKAVAASVAGLAKLQNRDGGFSWGGWSRESSEWATEEVLITLGIANSLGMLPATADISSLIDKGFAYLQKEASKKDRPSTDRGLALISALMPKARLTVEGSAIVRRTVAAISSNWRKDNTVGKAYDIIILKANGREAVASQILESIRQHSVVKPGMGLCFPNVDDVRTYATVIQAFAAMDAPKAEIDGMRQWITVRAQATDNLGACNPDYVIAAVMLTGSVWTDEPVRQSVTVDGRPLEIDALESSTGYFSQTIDAAGGATVKIVPNGVTPSYGSVVSVGRRPMATVKARPGRDISVEKRVLVQRAGKWVETTQFSLGERVRVELLVKASRDMQYVSIDDERPAAFEPVDQLPGYVYDGGLGFYRENRDASTCLFVTWLPKGTYHISYDMTASLEGSFVSGIATLQSQYAPELTAHSGASSITVE